MSTGTSAHSHYLEDIKMDVLIGANEFERQLSLAEEYEDILDQLHPRDRVEDLVSPAVKIYANALKKLALVVGHTKRSPGQYGVAPISSHEYEWNAKLANEIRTIASDRGIECGVFFRDGIGIEGAYKNVAAWDAATCIELHFNGYDSTASGTETLYGVRDISMNWASLVQDSLVKLFNRDGSANRGIKKRANRKGERGGKNVNQLQHIPSCLIEPFFGDSEDDARLGSNLFLELAATIVDVHEFYVSDTS